jgi:hypothetical protein
MKNKTKTISLMFVALLMFSFAGAFVLAEEIVTGDNILISAEPIPEGSSTGVFWDGLKRSLSFNKEKKAELDLIIAEKRMLKVGEFVDAGKYEQSLKMVDKQERAIERAESYFDEIETDKEGNATKRAIAGTIIMQNRIEAHEERALEIKARILERHAENMTEEQFAHLEEIFSRIEMGSQESLNRVELRQENLKVKYGVLSGMTGEEVEESFSEYNNYLEQRREIRVERIAKHYENIQERKESRLEIMEVVNSGNSVRAIPRKKVEDESLGEVEDIDEETSNETPVDSGDESLGEVEDSDELEEVETSNETNSSE